MASTTTTTAPRVGPSGPSPSPPDSVKDFLNPRRVIDVFEQAAGANLDGPFRHGSTICLPRKGRLLVTGDLHDHGVNLQRVLSLAALDENPDHRLVVQEILHGERRVNGADMSILTIAQIAALQLQYPGQIFQLQSNHELAQLGGEGITKSGVDVVGIFDEGLDFIYESSADAVRDALAAYIRSLPLAVRCPTGILCTHSLPSRISPKRKFDPSVLDRLPTDEDLRYNGSAYELVWGRRHPQKLADVLAKKWDVHLFVLGHQPTNRGYKAQGDTMLILDSSHDRGAALPLDLSRHYTRRQLIEQIIPLDAVVAEPAHT